MNTKGTYVTVRIAFIAATAGILVALSACSGGDSAGTPRPETTSTASSTSASSPTSSGNVSGSLADTDPCDLLKSSEAAELGSSGSPKREKVGTADTCKWKSTDSSFHVGIRTNMGIGQVQPDAGQVKDLTVGDRKAKQVSGNAAGTCIIALDVSSSSRVDVSAIGRPNEDPCPLALKVAELVEPKLP